MPRAVGDVGAIRDYNRLDIEGDEDQFRVERELGRIASLHSDALAVVNRSGNLDDDTRVRLIEFASLLQNRIPAVKASMTGDSDEAARLVNLFDRYSPEKAVVIPPGALEHR